MIPIIVIAVLVILGAGVLVIIGLRNPHAADEAELTMRLDEFAKRGEQINLEKIELSQPFSERVIYPVARKLGELAVKFTPQNALQNISRKLELAGSPANLDPTMLLSLQFIMAGVFGGLMILVFTFGRMSWSGSLKVILGLGMTVLGFYFPMLYLTSKINKRQKEIRQAMPDALDLLTICVEAGLGFDAAMNKVSEKWQTNLSLAFARVIKEVQLGKLRREALRDMADRMGIPEMTSFVAAIIQSELLGVSMSKVLRIQSDQMRIKRRQHAEEEAHKAPIKMLIPMGLLIFPALMVTLLSPAVLRIMRSNVISVFTQ
ncbi:MAG: type II secretion system F family protein [Anaerolineaceae bacterium]|nr:type II secretion system F family protein [Anaerolineaceae bacterium]